MTKPNLLLINPNTSPAITENVRRLAVAEAGSDASVDAVTARFGARYIASLISFSIAGHAVLDAYAAAVAGPARPDAVIIGCFGDPGIDGLREMVDIPVIGFAESGMIAAAAEPGNFVVATVGTVWHDILAGMAQQHGIADRFAGIVAIDEWVGDPALAAAEIGRAARQRGASRVIIGGTGLIPLIPKIERELDLPMIDPHRAAIRQAIAAAARWKPPARPTAAPTTQFLGLSTALERLLTAGDPAVHHRTTG